MEEDVNQHRHAAAVAARAYLSGKLSWDQFMEGFADSRDDLVGDLVDLIEHEPQRGGLLGLGEKDWADHQSQVAAAIATLESEE